MVQIVNGTYSPSLIVFAPVDKEFSEELRLLGTHLQNLRREKGFTQEKMAELLAIDSNYLSKIECGMRSPALKTLLKFPKVLGIPRSRIFDF